MKIAKPIGSAVTAAEAGWRENRVYRTMKLTEIMVNMRIVNSRK